MRGFPKAAGLGLAVATCLTPHAVHSEIPAPEAYLLHCSGCHGPDGSGDDRMIPSLREIAPLLEVEGGREYLVRVPGVAQAALPSDALATLLNFILREMAGAKAFEPFDEKEVSRLRRVPLRDPIGSRPNLDPK